MSNLLLDETIQANIETIVGDTIDDLWLNIAWERLTDDLGYEPYSEETTETHFGSNTRFLYLDKRPVTALSSVYINDSEQDVDDYSIYEERAIESDTAFVTGYTYLKSTLNTEIGLRRVKVTYTGGYTADNFPYSLQLAVSMLIQNMQATINNGSNLTSYKIDEISYAFRTFAETNAEYNAILDKYRGI